MVSFAQGDLRANISELHRQYENEPNDSLKVNYLLKLAGYHYSFDMDSTVLLLQKAAEYSENVDYKQGMAESNFRLGVFYYTQKKESSQTIIGHLAKARNNFELLLDSSNTDIVTYYMSMVYRSKGDVASSNLLFKQATQGCQAKTTRCRHIFDYFHQIAWKASLNGNFIQAHEGFEECLRSARKTNDSLYTVKALYRIAQNYKVQGDVVSSKKYIDRGLALASAIKSNEEICRILNLKANILKDQGKYPEAMDIYLATLSISESINYPPLTANILNNIGNLLREEGEFDESLSYYEKSLEIEIGNNNNANNVYLNIGHVYKAKGDFDKAFEYFNFIWNTARDTIQKIKVYNDLGELEQERGNYSGALQWYKRSIDISPELSHMAEKITTNNLIGSLYLEQNNLEEAIYYLNESLQLIEQTGHYRMKGEIQNKLASIYAKQGNHNKALSYYTENYNFLKAIGDLHELSKSCIGIGSIHLLQGGYQNALNYYKESLDISKKNEVEPIVAQANHNIANCYLKLENIDLALEYALEADKFNSLPNQVSNSILLMEIFSKANNSKLALQYAKNHITLKDSLNNLNNTLGLSKALKEMEVQRNLEVVKKEKQYQETILRGQKKLIGILSSAAMLTILGLVLIFRSNIKIRSLLNKNQLMNDKLSDINKEQDLIVNSVPVGICKIDKNLNIQWSNGFIRNFYKANNDLPNDGVSIKKVLHPDAFLALSQLLEERKNNDKISFETAMNEDLAPMPEFQEGFFWKKITCIPYRNNKGGVESYIVLDEDHSKSKMDELKLQQQKNKLAEKNSELETTLGELEESNNNLQNFASIAAHDLKAPLRTVSGFIKILSKKYKSNIKPEDEALFTFVDDSCKNLSAMIDGLLKFSRLSRDLGEYKPVVLNDLFARVHDLLQDSITENNAVIVKLSDFPVVLGHSSLLEQLFLNLINNAIRFRKKDIPPIIKISCQEVDGQSVQIKVQDNGIGIAKEHQEGIFQIFRKLHPSGSYDGSGMGLAISKKIVERNGGKIWVESNMNEGSSFFVLLLKASPMQNQS